MADQGSASGQLVTDVQQYARLFDVRCEWCDVWLAKATHVVRGVHCSAPCFTNWREVRRKGRTW